MARLRNAKNIAKLIDGQVFVNFNEETPKIGNSTYGLFGYGWHTVGFLAGGSSMSITKETNEEAIEALGMGEVAKKVTPGAITLEFDALEKNEVTDRIEWNEEWRSTPRR